MMNLNKISIGIIRENHVSEELDNIKVHSPISTHSPIQMHNIEIYQPKGTVSQIFHL
jgi:hypothetical protein